MTASRLEARNGIKDLRREIHIFELRGFAPIGMLEYWNYGIMGFGRIDYWYTGAESLKRMDGRARSVSLSYGKVFE